MEGQIFISPQFLRAGNSMSGERLFERRSLRLCYWNSEARLVDAERMSLEKHLAHLGPMSVTAVRSLDAPELSNANLLIVAAQTVPEQKFAEWLRGFTARIKRQGQIWTPALILADMPFDVLREILPEAHAENWYFDILSPAHMASLPIRVANLLRIHDHLHEMTRYEQVLDEINAKVKSLEDQVAGLKK